MRKILRLESSIEKSSVLYSKAQGADSIKVIKNGYPDRLFTLFNGYCFYVEFKNEKSSPRPLQVHNHKLLRLNGFHVYVCSSVLHFKSILNYEMGSYKSEKFKELGT